MRIIYVNALYPQYYPFGKPLFIGYSQGYTQYPQLLCRNTQRNDKCLNH